MSVEASEAAPKAVHAAEAVLGLVDQFAKEFHPGSTVSARLDSLLEQELGFDSLARVELLARIERAFCVQLPEDTLATAETPQDLLRALERAGAAVPAGEFFASAPAALERVEGLPQRATTLLEVLEWHVNIHPERAHVLLYRTGDEAQTMSYRQLQEQAYAVAAGLRARGIQRGQAVAIMLPTSLEFFHSFYGVLLAGGIPVPMYPPARLTQIEDHLRRQSGILASCLAPILITVSEVKPLAALMRGLVDSLRSIVTVKELCTGVRDALRPVLRGEDTALLQYTSGSTGNPKGVVLSHVNLLANIRAWGSVIDMRSTDVSVSWLPLYHDMGLIGAWLGSLYHACLLVLMSPLDFLARPERWLWAIHRHKGTFTGAPNFAFELCLRRLEEAQLEGLDLSSCRMAANGAEPVSPDTVTRFCERFARYGFAPSAMMPVYGLAECALGLAVPRVGRGARIDRIQREVFMRSGQAVPASADDAHALRFVGCGKALPGHHMRIVDNSGRALPERRVGRLEFCGPSATQGYFRNAEETRRLFHGEWLDSGDLAYMAEGEVFLTSRAKDMIIRGGHNIYPYELEEVIGELAGVRKGCVAVFGAADPVAATEHLVVVAETRQREASVQAELRRQINALAVELLGAPPDDVVLAPPHSVLKTSSGKIRRAATREVYLAGTLGLAGPKAWRQLLRLSLAGMQRQLRRGAGATLQLLYSFYAWMVCALAVPLVWFAVALTRQPAAAWALTRFAARGFLRAVAIPLRVTGLERLPVDSPCVVVANHTSYLDGLVLMAALPRPFSFIAKQEFKRSFFARIFLEGIGAEFVERFAIQRSLEDAQRLAQRAQRGQSFFFFAEGTFTRAAGLRPFHTGAFLIAAQAHLPVVPIALRGIRAILPDRSWLPRRGGVEVYIDQPIAPSGDDWAAALALRDAAHARILAQCGEAEFVP